MDYNSYTTYQLFYQPMQFNPDGGIVHGSLGTLSNSIPISFVNLTAYVILVLLYSEGPVPVIRLYGVTSQGHSVMASVHGFTPYFYVSLPSSIHLSDSFLGQIRSALDQRVSSILKRLSLISSSGIDVGPITCLCISQCAHCLSVKLHVCDCSNM